MSRLPHIEAEVEFITTEKGGRQSPASSGYRPQFYYHGNDWVAELTFPDSKEVMPGEVAKTRLRFMSPKEHFGNLVIGMPFLIREGTRTLAYGIVTQIFEELESDAATE